MEGHAADSRRIPPEHTEALCRHCRERGLLSPAGSDVHFEERIAEGLGVHCGSEDWLGPFLERVGAA